jgi:hypothetical protein
MGKIMGELGRVLVSSQQILAAMEKMLEAERERIIRVADDKPARDKHHTEWNNWWYHQKAERVREWKEAKESYIQGTQRKKKKKN